MFVDEDKVDVGCFATAINIQGWVIGRNFDFDIDGLFDKEKILKWSYPDKGNAYLSIIWSGMVGAVSGVNDKGIFASTNAAGTEDFSRLGTPTTIVLKNILTNANNLDQAIQILQDSQVFISEIFLIVDAKNQQVAVVEKSPQKISIKKLNQDTIIANHFTDPLWIADKINNKRKLELTSDFRYKRGLELLNQDSGNSPVQKTIAILRDRSLYNNRSVHLGHGGSIDSLIASQSLVYDSKKMILYINLGPGTIGKYLGYDLKQSFSKQLPVVVTEFKASDLVPDQYQEWHKKYQQIIKLKSDLQNKSCEEIESSAAQILKDLRFSHYNKSIVLGDYEKKCNNDLSKAKSYWTEALSFSVPYKKVRDKLEANLK
jgi:hypothetical protein